MGLTSLCLINYVNPSPFKITIFTPFLAVYSGPVVFEDPEPRVQGGWEMTHPTGGVFPKGWLPSLVGHFQGKHWRIE